MVKNMQTLKPRKIESYAHSEIKKLFCGLFVRSRRATNRVRIISALRKMPSNRNQLATELGIEYKAVQHHLKVLEKNYLVRKSGDHYGVIYCVSSLFENSEFVFDEIVDRLKNLNRN